MMGVFDYQDVNQKDFRILTSCWIYCIYSVIININGTMSGFHH